MSSMSSNPSMLTVEALERSRTLARENIARLKAQPKLPPAPKPQRDYKPRPLASPVLTPSAPARTQDGEGGGLRVRARRAERVVEIIDGLKVNRIL
jgi:hypothetical protein